jgi:uncharacterized membrane protein YeaQ/YmgE (transglycosylase-associated protein family)
MGILWMAIIGLIAGALAKLLMPGRQGGGILITMALGVAGAVLAGFLGTALGFYDEPGEGPGLIAATLGALLVLVIYGAVTRRRGVVGT